MAPFIILFVVDPVNSGAASGQIIAVVVLIRAVVDGVINILPRGAEHIYCITDVDAAADLGVIVLFKYLRAVLVENIYLSVLNLEVDYP